MTFLFSLLEMDVLVSFKTDRKFITPKFKLAIVDVRKYFKRRIKMSQGKSDKVKENTNESIYLEMAKQFKRDGGIWVALLYKSFSKVLPPDVVERCHREAMREFGILKANRDGHKISPEEWVEKAVVRGPAEIYQTEIAKKEDHSELIIHCCPALEGWKELGCSPEEIDLLCDTGMESDRAHIESHGIEQEIPNRMGKGDPYCQVILRRPIQR